MKKIIALLLCLVLAAVSVAVFAEGESDKDYVIGKGKLIVGITDFEPMDFKDENGEWIGFDADLARAFAEYLGVEIEFQALHEQRAGRDPAHEPDSGIHHRGRPVQAGFRRGSRQRR